MRMIYFSLLFFITHASIVFASDAFPNIHCEFQKGDDSSLIEYEAGKNNNMITLILGYRRYDFPIQVKYNKNGDFELSGKDIPVLAKQLDADESGSDDKRQDSDVNLSFELLLSKNKNNLEVSGYVDDENPFTQDVKRVFDYKNPKKFNCSLKVK